jgi:hypothetical protein
MGDMPGAISSAWKKGRQDTGAVSGTTLACILTSLDVHCVAGSGHCLQTPMHPPELCSCASPWGPPVLPKVLAVLWPS